MNEIIYNSGVDKCFNLTESIISLIGRARQWIKACNLFFDDPQIREALSDALSRGVAVFILTNLQGATAGKEKDKKSGKMKQGAQSAQNFAHAESISYLYEEGAHISGLDGLHAKFLLIDDKTGVVTSANFTPNSTSKITEVGVLVSDAEFDELEEIFDCLFLRPDKYKFANNGTHYSFERPGQPIDTDVISRKSKVRLTLGPTDRGTGFALQNAKCFDLRDEIFSIITDTQPGEDLYIATYSLESNAAGPNGTTLLQALLDAKKRGVKLHIVQRDKDGKNSLKGIYVQYHPDNHAKLVLSSQRGILFPGNLTNESFGHGFDLGVTLTDEQINEAKIFIEKLIKKTEQ